MSDVSDDDFANNYGPTTPAPPKKARGGRVGGRPVAGPSTKPTSKITVAKKPANRAPSTIELDDDEEDQDVVMVDEQPANKRRKPSEDSEEVVAMPGPPPKSTARKTASRTEPATNGIIKAAVTKGKARADAPPKTGKVNGAPTAEEEERDEVMELDDSDKPLDPPAQRAVRSSSKQPKPTNASRASTVARSNKAEEKLAREVENLREQLERSRESAKEIATQRDKLAKQLEEVFRIRHTEPEQLLEEYKSQFDENINRKEALIEELTAQLAKLQSSSKSNKSHTLHFLTREVAEEEKQALRDENLRLKDVIKQRDATIASKDKQIHALQEEGMFPRPRLSVLPAAAHLRAPPNLAKTVKKELDAEIERSKSLARTPAPTAAARQQKLTPSEPRNTPVIRLYEDMTNILVTGVKIDKSPDFPELDEEILACIYTYQSLDDDKLTFSLNFSLRNVYERPPDSAPGTPIPKENLILKVKYEPRDLDKERPEIVERLAFFKDPFMFARNQMTVFLKTLTDTVSSIFEPEGEGDESGAVDRSPEVVVVEK
ncbi:hypothetical protein BN946_scf184963.g4 [Trametes cinnabarina]|uniref:Monopolin complex subunit Csm1/Pcs1 C-terminal domain-containing protein n=1 Tax=Pycnoporus cinnabarinus TaxID=5643 RepID=A0A060SSX3_PYCCI|nr:hypothetical protein BN946_scf184963.g4 [Trametes cinnabarina]